MKHKHMFSLLDQSFTTVRVIFNAEAQLQDSPLMRAGPERNKLTTPWRDNGDGSHAHPTGRSYVYKVPKSWDVQVEQHLVVVDRGGDLAVVFVVQVDSAPDIDVDAAYDYKWAVAKVDMTEFHDLNRREKQFGEAMLEIERTKQRESLVASFRDSLPEGSEARRLFEQTTSSLGAPTIEHPPVQPSAPASEG